MVKRKTTISELNKLEAIKRHPEFQKELTAWTDLFERERSEGFHPTEEDLKRLYGPRSGWSRRAEMEASRYKSVSEAIAWHKKFEDPGIAAWRTLQPKETPDGLTVTLPLHQPVQRTLDMVERILKLLRERNNIQDTQPLKPTLLDPWWVWDEIEVHKKSRLRVAKELARSTDDPNVNLEVKRYLGLVNRAYKRAQMIMATV